mmetsp:Transcript_6121/g.9396  ORF Transcript_6121/g.9396 Transcript_6121/m.9396 type:complete len:262 (+) Transcript_6121:149-934(+)
MSSSYQPGEKRQSQQGGASSEPLRDADNNDEEIQDEQARINVQKWKQSPYAVGYGDADWNQEVNCCKYCCTSTANNSDQPHNFACNQITSCFCPCAGRIGNMVVLYENSSTEPPEPVVMVGPYWPFMCCVTYPIIIGVLTLTAIFRIPYMHWGLVAVWIALSVALLLSLACVACRNPGILKRTEEERDDWIWNDQALSFRPSEAKYDRDCNCVIEGFDHTCPWTGTGIGKGNIRAFYCFICLVPLCLIFNVVLLTLPIFSL